MLALSNKKIPSGGLSTPNPLARVFVYTAGTLPQDVPRLFRKYPEEVMPVGREQTILVRQASPGRPSHGGAEPCMLPLDERSDGTI